MSIPTVPEVAYEKAEGIPFMAHAYDTKEKQATRCAIWGVLRERSQHGDALLMPGPRRYEFDTVISQGYKPEQLLLVESNPAVRANFTRLFSKQEQQQLRWQSGDLSEVSKTLVAQDHHVVAAHLDFCKPLSFFNANSPAVQIEKFIKSGVMLDGLLAITVLGGREQDGTDADKGRYQKMESAVNLRIEFAVPRKATLLVQGKYFNEVTHNAMIWAIFEITRKTP